MENGYTHMIYHTTPVGLLRLCADDGGVCGIYYVRDAGETPAGSDSDLLRKAAQELDEYFAGQRRTFDLPLSMHGTPFQQRVWRALLQIPYGQTRSYGQVAAMTGNAKASRAVGMANHRNPISIVVPCHRVINADGGLGGYSGGLEAKEFLLHLEGHSF